ncbi:COX15/CtaA family protein [Kallotenue papyrolyticum]|uniref:COX15/CtaA family protein n=1 Tax=Kallotenue papyrolyticum TaxID=1325125 RepID=UPI0005B86238|nr:COX15/CtaA family protein [Kallotenue papyrolyticum]
MAPTNGSTSRRFVRYAGGVLIYNIGVILWGAFVRATGSGAGCGSHWPTCNGQVIPRAPEVETLIEFTHRLTSGLAGLLVLGLFVWAMRRFARGHPARLGATWALIFMVIEALIGALLVRAGLVADNASLARAVMIALHLVNTFLLLAWLALTVWWGAGGPPLRLRGHEGLATLLGIAILVTILLGASGAVTALGDTLFPVDTLHEGLRRDFSTEAHFLERLRIIHPVIAMLLGLYLIGLARFIARRRPTPLTRRLVLIFGAIYATQLIVGMINVRLLAPVALQIIHLLLADLIWIALILLSAAALAAEQPAWASAPALPAHTAARDGTAPRPRLG